MAATPQVPAQGEARQRRRRRAAVAAQLLALAPDSAGSLDWDSLERAPGWLALPGDELTALIHRVGALVAAPQLRLWIDGARLDAARSAVGAAFLQSLLARRDNTLLPRDVTPCPRIEVAEQVAPALHGAGAAVLLAATPTAALRKLLSAAWAAAPAAMATELAQSQIAQAQALAAEGKPQPQPPVTKEHR